MGAQLTIQHDDGATRLFYRAADDAALEELGQARPFGAPIGDADLEELRFYLEDTLSRPDGERDARGLKVEKESLAAWGGALFEAVFDGDTPRLGGWWRITDVNRAPHASVLIRSADPRVLSLPWELMLRPNEPLPLSLQLASFDRASLSEPDPLPMPDAGDGLRVLMAIARPGGAGDGGGQLVALPLLEQVKGLAGRVRIDVLRPPSFDALQRRLAAARDEGAPYHAVHFDGYGGVDESANGPTGFLCFVGARPTVPATEFAQALRQGETPLAILNARRLGAVAGVDAGTQPSVAIAAQLLKHGAASALAMSCDVHEAASAAFMATFFERLFAGRSVGEALNDGRKALHMNLLRPSLRQPTRLGDWIAPVLFACETQRLSGVAEAIRASAKMPREAWAEAMARGRSANLSEGDSALAAADGLFFGRRAQLNALEKACEVSQPALIHGEPGVGKTELAKAFGRWMAASGGVDQPGFVCFHGFEPGAVAFDLDPLLTEIYARVVGADLDSVADTAERRAEIVLQALTQHRCLLILDGFDAVAGMNEQSRTALTAFLERAPQTGSGLILASRSTEDWLGGSEALARIELGGLRGQDAFAYADALLADSATARENRAENPQAFAEILERLDGVPLVLKQILPHLETSTPTQILETIKGESETPVASSASEPMTEGEASPALEPASERRPTAAEHLPEAAPTPESEADEAPEAAAPAEPEITPEVSPAAESDLQPEPALQTEPDAAAEPVSFAEAAMKAEPESTSPDPEPVPEATQADEPAPLAEPVIETEPNAAAEPIAADNPDPAAERPPEPAPEPEPASEPAPRPAADLAEPAVAAEPTPAPEAAAAVAPEIKPAPSADPTSEPVPEPEMTPHAAEPASAPRPALTAEIAQQRARMLALLARHKKDDDD